MSGVAVKRLDELENNHGVYYRARAGLGVTAFGLAIEHWPADFDGYPEHDESSTGQEEVYIVLAGTATLRADGAEYALEPDMLVRISPGVMRKIVPGPDGVKLVCIGGVPGGVYTPPAFTENGAPWR